MDTPPSHHAPSFEVKPSDGSPLPASLTAASNHRPDAKAQRYDRQLRLWAASGQAALESAHILVVNGTATATSILKNLVLPGVGHFTILDDAKVDRADLGNNFFLQPGESKVGASRAEEVIQYLGELNDGVRKDALVMSVRTFLESSDEPLAPYSLVICVDAPPEETLLLSDRCWSAGVPMMAVRSCGFVGSARTQMQEVHFIETHPEQEATIDLRLDVPFESLASYAQSIDFSALDSHEYAHIPPVIILLQALEKWKQTHEGNIPKNYAEKNQFKKMIGEMKRGGKGADEENFEEAMGMVMKSVKPTKIPTYIEMLFADGKCDQVSKDSAPFWILLRAVRDFVQDSSTNGGSPLLPLSGSLPDMKATSSGYAKLQSVYKAKAKEDLAWVQNQVQQICTDLGIENGSGKFIDEEAVTVFVKNCPFVKVVKGRKMRDEYERPDINEMTAALEQASLPDPFAIPAEEAETPSPIKVQPIHFYLALRASNNFYIEHSRWPGSFVEDENDSLQDEDLEKLEEALEADLEGMKEALIKVKRVCLGTESPEINEAEEKALAEITRAGGSDLPQMAALLGGMVAQEAIKIITKQYVPLNGTVVFDGIRSGSETFDF